MWCGGPLSAAEKQIRGGEQQRSGNSSGVVDGCDVGAAAVRRRTEGLKWLGYDACPRRGGSSASASTAKSWRALRLRLRWTTTSGYRLRRDGGGRWWIGAMGWRTEEAGVERVFWRPRSTNGEMEGERGRGNHVFGTCLSEMWESYELSHRLKFRTSRRLGIGQ